MKRKKGLIVFLIVAAVVVGVVLWQKNNIQILINAEKYSSDELETKIDDERDKIADEVENTPYIHVRDLDEDEVEAFREGDLTTDELVEILTQTDETDSASKTPGGEDGGNKTNQTDQSSTANRPSKEFETDISKLIARVYIMRQEYTNALDAMALEARDAHYALPESEQTKTKIAKWAASYLERATELEHECDQKMDDIVSELRKILNENNGDETLVDKVIEGYASEKSLKKAWYLSQMKERGLL